MARTIPFLIGGELVAPARAEPVRSPYSGEEAGRAGAATGLEMERALAAAAGARGAMAALPAYRRREALLELERAVAGAQDELATLMAEEAAKPIRDARLEVARAQVTLRTAAEEAVRMGGEMQPLEVAPGAEGAWALVRRFPRGLIAGITPFNFPLNLVLHKLAPAVASGNSVIVKLSPRAPLTGLRVGELAQALDLPPGGVNIVCGGAEAVEPLLADERVAMISFTGSAAVGWGIKARAGRKFVTLELGGNAANIVHADADLDWAAGRLTAGGFGYAGQSCISAQRVLIHQDVYARLREDLVARAQNLRLGDPLDPATEVGPMISDEAARRAEGWIREAVAGGARLLCGGDRDGAFLTPAVLEAVPPEASLCREEAFAPVLVLAAYATPAEAFAAANASRYGLQAGLFTRDWNLIWQAYRALEVGGVVVNEASAARIEPMPYGGVKDSGLGREGLRAAIEEMTERRVLLLREPPF